MKKILLLVALLLLPTLAQAQSQRNPCYNTLSNSATVSSSTNCIPVGTNTPLPVVQPNSFTNITTNADTVVKASPGLFAGISVNTAGVTSAVTVYNNSTCTGTKIGVYSTTAQVVLNVNAIATVGICATTTGGTPADITILWQ